MPPPEQRQIRLARPENAAVIAALLHDCFIEFKPLYTEAGFAATTPRPDQIIVRMSEGPVWIAAREGVIVGTVAAMIKDTSAYIRGMGVLPAARGAGLASQLLQQLEAWARGQGSASLLLSTTPFLHSAIRLYASSGFRRTGRGPHDLFGTPLFTMEKTLPNR